MIVIPTLSRPSPRLLNSALRASTVRFEDDGHWSLAVDGLFSHSPTMSVSIMISEKIGQSTPIVAEGEQIADRRNSRLKSTAQFSGGSERRFFSPTPNKITLEIQRVSMAQNNRVGVGVWDILEGAGEE